MRIRGFSFIVEEHAVRHQLKDCILVIDAQNFFYGCYEKSCLRYEFGAECDRYAKYLKGYLSMFKKANIGCYFIFKGGTKNLEKKIGNVKKYQAGELKLINPIFMIDIHLEVLKEMGFNYVFSEFESKSDCMTLARRLSCPVLSSDIEFPLSGVQYIPKNSLEFKKNKIVCKLFSMNTFLRNFRLDKNKLALFILLSDVSIFPEKSFDKFFVSRRIPIQFWERNKILLQDLSKVSEEKTLIDITETTNMERELIDKELCKVKKTVEGEINSQMATNYFFNRREISDWFISGVAKNYIAKEYVDIYRSKVLFKELFHGAEFLKPSLDIIKYAFDLLTGFENDGLKFILRYPTSQTVESTVITKDFKKPVCEADHPIFQYGWDKISSHGLFQHFIEEQIQFDCNKLERVPDDAKMLMITLVYILRYSKLKSDITTFTTEMAYGLLLSYIMLGIVQERVDNIYTDNNISISDCESALDSLSDYFNVYNVQEIMDDNLLISLKQFQYCLLQMNYLNKLCGSPFKPTSYRKTYNGTLVYKVLYTMQNEDIILSINNILSSAPTVLEYFLNIVDIFKTLL